MEIEYVTDPVLRPKLRCASCRGPVRQMREELSASQSLLVFLLGEPLGSLVLAIGVLAGLLAEALLLMLFAWLVVVPFGLVWLNVHRLYRASFLCSRCTHISSYTEARQSARLWQAQVKQR
jgi:hypothetical protein